MTARKKITLQFFYEEFQKRMTGVEDHLGKVETRLGTVEDHLGKVETRLGTVESVQRTVVGELVGLKQRMDALEQTVVGMKVRLDVLTGLTEKLEKHIERLDHEYVAITAGLRRLEEHFDQSDAAVLARRVAALEAKVRILEKREN